MENVLPALAGEEEEQNSQYDSEKNFGNEDLGLVSSEAEDDKGIEDNQDSHNDQERKGNLFERLIIAVG